MPISSASVLAPVAATYGWQDCQCQPLATPGPAPDPARLLQAFIQSAPGWVDGLMRLRDRIVAPLGLKTAASAPFVPDGPLQVGTRVGVFRILQLAPHELVLGEDDRHLDFRISLLWQPGALHISTLVRPHNLAGRAYLALVTPWHHLIAQTMARRMVRGLERGAC